MEPAVCIIILNWNCYEVTRDCLNSLSSIAYTNFKVIVVDNGSHDASIDKLKNEFSDTFLDCVELEVNHGFTGGNNIGIEYALEKYAPDYYLLLNNDTVVDKFFLKEMIEPFLNNPDCFAVVPKIYYYDQKEILWFAGGHVNRLTGLAKQYGRHKIDTDKYNHQKKITFMNGCASLISKEAITELGLLDDRFFIYSEDTDYSLRILESNHSIIYAPKAFLYHKVSYASESNRGKWFVFYLATRNIIFLQKKHLPKFLIPVFAIAFGVRWVMYLTLKLTVLRDFKSVRAIYQGVEDGIRNRSRFYKKPAVKQKVLLGQS